MLAALQGLVAQGEGGGWAPPALCLNTQHVQFGGRVLIIDTVWAAEGYMNAFMSNSLTRGLDMTYQLHFAGALCVYVCVWEGGRRLV